MTKDLSSSSFVHWRWCNHSMTEMRSLGSCQGLVLVAILAGAQAAWRELFATQCQDRPTKDGTLLLISMESWWLRLEGKPHFKRWGMSRTSLLMSGCQVGQATGTGEATKGKGLGPAKTIEQNRDELVFLLRTRSSLYLLLFLNPSL